MKLLLDEMYPAFIARRLRAGGHEVVSVHESPGSGTPDGEVFDFARSEGRAILTENVRDYRPLAQALLAAGGSHASLVLTTEKRWPRGDPGALITALDRLLASTPRRSRWTWNCGVRLGTNGRASSRTWGAGPNGRSCLDQERLWRGRMGVEPTGAGITDARTVLKTALGRSAEIRQRLPAP